MNVSRRYILQASGALALAAACARPARAAAVPLTLGYVPSTLFAPVFVALERGFLTEAGYAPDAVPITAGQDAIALLAQGRLDVVAGGVSAAFFNGVNRGFDVRLVASTGYQPRRGHPSGLMVRSDLFASGLRSVAGLRGKKIAWIGGVGAVSTYYVARILRAAGLSLGDVEVVAMANPDQGVAFERKAIDASFTPEPFTSDFERRSVARLLAAPPGGISGTGLLFGSSLLADKAAAARVLGAFRRAAPLCRGASYGSAENLQAYAKYTQQPTGVLHVQDPYDFDPRLRIDIATLADMQTVFQGLPGVLAYKTPLPTDKLIANL